MITMEYEHVELAKRLFGPFWLVLDSRLSFKKAKRHGFLKIGRLLIHYK
jgi:hypothetical protein